MTRAAPDGDFRGEPGPRPGRARSRLLFLAVAVVIAGFCAASGLTLLELRQSTYAQAVKDETNLLNAFAQDIARNIEVYDASLKGVVDGLALPDLAGLSPHFQDLLLYDRSISAKDLGAILVLDRTGRVVRGSRPEAVGSDFSDREYFLAQRQRPDRGLFISAPFVRRVTGSDQVVALSRALRAPDGAFAGVVVGTMQLSYFRDLFSSADVGPRGAVNLFRTDGIALMRVPFDPARIGASFAASGNFQRFLRSRSGTFAGTAAVDGVDRIYSFTHVGDLPLIVNVALAEADVFAVWKTKTAIITAALLTLCAMAAALAYGLRRQLHRTAQTQAMLRRSEAQHRLFADHAQDVILRLDRGLRQTFVSPAVAAMLGHAPAEMLGRPLEGWIHPEDWPTVATLIVAAQGEGTNAEATCRLRHRDGHHVWAEGRYSTVPGDGGFVAVLRDVGKRKAAEEKLEALNAELALVARSDALTGLANRRAFDETLEREWRRAARENAPMSLLLLDIDRFKGFNDRYGHQEGDACLRAVAAALRDAVRRSGDFTARYGGEELVVVMPSTDAAGAARVAERVRADVEGLRIPHLGNPDCGAVVTASLGCATLRAADLAEAADGPAALVARADACLYEAKRAGRNRVGPPQTPPQTAPQTARDAAA